MKNKFLKNKILIVEDDETIASGLLYALRQEGYNAARCKTVAETKSAVQKESFDLAILDMQLPDGSGFDAGEALKSSGAAVIFLTVVDDEGNIVRAFESGAEDYITKPFRLYELLARIKRALNRKDGAGGASTGGAATLGRVVIETQSGKAYLDGEPLNLTALEYRLALTFANNKGKILSRPQILERIWDAEGAFVEDNTLTVYVKRLREKLGGSANIETVRGLGYRAD